MDYFPNGRDTAMINWPVYETSMEIIAGASGGPVVGANGAVFAVNTSGVNGFADISYVTPIDFILDAIIDDVIVPPDATPRSYKLRDLARSGFIRYNPPFPTRA